MRREVTSALVVLALLVPATAEAATRCVPAAVAGCDSSHTTISQAVTAATDGDTISIAAGTYTQGIVTSKRLNIVGEGGGTLEEVGRATILAPPGGTALSLQSGGSVRGIRAIGGKSAAGKDALKVEPIADGTYTLKVSDFVGIGGGSTADLGTGGSALSSYADDPAKKLTLDISNSQFRAGGGVDSYGMFLYGRRLSATISRSRVVGTDRIYEGRSLSAVALHAGDSVVTIEDSTVMGGLVAARLNDGDFTVRRSRLIGTPGSESSGIGLQAYDGGTFGPPLKLTVEDSLVIGEPGYEGTDSYALAATVYTGSETFTINVRGSTLIARGADADGAVGLLTPGGTPPTATIDLRNTVARLDGPEEPGEAALVANHGKILASSSAFSSVATMGAGTATAAGSGKNVVGDLGLGADFVPLANSQLIDRGDPAAAYAGELDINGTARSQDGTGDCVAAPDIGAFERASRCPVKDDDSTTPKLVAPRISKLSLSRKRFTLRKPRHKGRKRGSTLRFVVSERVDVLIAVERKLKGRKVKVRGKRRCAKPTRSNATKPRCVRYVKTGTQRVFVKGGSKALELPAKLGRKLKKPGAYRLSLIAIDDDGLRSKPARIALTVQRP